MNSNSLILCLHFPYSLLILLQSYDLSNGGGELGQYSKANPSKKMGKEGNLESCELLYHFI